MAADVAGPELSAVHARTRHPILSFLTRRLLQGIATLLVASFVIFFATNALPGDVATAILGKNATPQNTQLLRKRLHLDRPFVQRYGEWLADAVQGNLGQSGLQIAQGASSAPVSNLIRVPLRNSLILGGISTLLLIPLSIILGVVAGAHAGRPVDHIVSMTALVFNALPEFVLATFLIVIFFTQLNLLPPLALLNPGQSPFSKPDGLILPVLTLLGVTTASCARQIRAGMIEVLRQDFVAMARLNGIPHRRVLWRYALRNGLAPAVQIVAQNVQYLIGGIIVVESVFTYPGIGEFLVNAVGTRDVTEVAGVAVLLAAVYIFINVIADLLVILLVPKLRTSGS